LTDGGKSPNTKFCKSLFSESCGVPCGEADRETDTGMTKLTATFHPFADLPILLSH